MRYIVYNYIPNLFFFDGRHAESCKRDPPDRREIMRVAFAYILSSFYFDCSSSVMRQQLNDISLFFFYNLNYFPFYCVIPSFFKSFNFDVNLVHFRRAEANESDTTLIVGGLDWMSVQHLDTIQQVLNTYF